MIEIEDTDRHGSLEDGSPAIPEFVRLLIDVTVSEDHAFESEITDYPVESGGTISDNIRQRPITVSIEGIISNTPLGQMRALRPDSEIAAQVGHAFLMQVWTSRATVTLRTSIGTFKKMALSSVNFPRSKDTGNALHFSARFQQIVTVTNARVSDKRVALRGGGGGKKKDLGAQPAVLKDRSIVVWRKGVIFTNSATGAFQYHGGSTFIREWETVYWMEHSDLAPKTAAERIEEDRTGRRDGKWFGANNRPLNAEEEARFRLDMARDLRGGVTDSRGIRGDAVQTNFAPKYDASANKTKKPVDLNASNKIPKVETYHPIFNPGSTRGGPNLPPQTSISGR